MMNLLDIGWMPLLSVAAIIGLGGMRWWKSPTKLDPEMHEAFATMYLIGAVICGVSWLLNSSDWQAGLIALAALALAMFHFWRSRIQFSLRTVLIFMTYTAVIIGLSSAALHYLKK
jgi:hypothetical protein